MRVFWMIPKVKEREKHKSRRVQEGGREKNRYVSGLGWFLYYVEMVSFSCFPFSYYVSFFMWLTDH